MAPLLLATEMVVPLPLPLGTEMVVPLPLLPLPPVGSKMASLQSVFDEKSTPVLQTENITLSPILSLLGLVGKSVLVGPLEQSRKGGLNGRFLTDLD